MDDLQIERLKSAIVVMGEGLQRAAEALADAATVFAREAAAKALGADLDQQWDEKQDDYYAELARRFDEMRAAADPEFYVVEAEPLPPPKKIPRPAKYIGPVNKANYTANRPPRKARSSCRVIKH